MKITNKHELPQALVDAVRPRDPQEKTYSVTELLNGVREIVLRRRHFNGISEDVSERIWAIFGTAVHAVLERQEESDTEFREVRLSEEIHGIKISGQFDRLKDKRITDYKTASVWKVIFQDFKRDEEQILVYSYLLMAAGFEVRDAQIVYFLKDHSMSKAKFDNNYPDLPVYGHRFVIVPSTAYAAFFRLADKAKACEEQKDAPEPTVCTDEERWYSGSKYAVKKKNTKRAERVFESEKEAIEYLERKEKGYEIEHRPGVDRKCVDYCSVKEFCSYYKENYMEGVKTNGKNESV